MNQLTLKNFFIAVAAFGLFEAISYLGFRNNLIGSGAFLLACLGTAYIAWRNLESGLVILFAELFVGGKGYLLSYSAGGGRLSIRIAIFIIIVMTWAMRHRGQGNPLARIPATLRLWIGFLGGLVTIGVINGLVHHRGFGPVYFDANAFLFFALVPILFSPHIHWPRLTNRLLVILAASAAILGIKSLISLGIFAHLDPGQLKNYYRWIRITGVGEIAYINGNAYRVFFQSQIFGLFAALMFSALLLPTRQTTRRPWWLLVPITLGATAVMISLSRSFWIGAAVGLVAGAVLGWKRWHWTPKQALATGGVGLAVVGLAFTLTSWALHFPYPFPPSKGSETAKLIGARFEALGGEAAASSRLNQLGPLREGIQRSPLLGSGFGTQLTYQSNDPRQLQSPTKGVFTTSAFEWGYLDAALKIGIIGLAAYLGLLWIIVAGLWRNQTRLSFGAMLAILSLAAVHVTTPYLNHPIGIGLLLLGMCFAGFVREEIT